MVVISDQFYHLKFIWLWVIEFLLTPAVKNVWPANIWHGKVQETLACLKIWVGYRTRWAEGSPRSPIVNDENDDNRDDDGDDDDDDYGFGDDDSGRWW